METSTALIEFLLARIAEDEARARSGIEALGDWAAGSANYDADALLWQARRTLVECEAWRRIVERCGSEVRQQELNPRRSSFDTSERYTLRALAVVHADHTDYREEWRT